MIPSSGKTSSNASSCFSAGGNSWRPNPLVAAWGAFHTRHKLLILAHSTTHYRELGRLVARAKEIPAQELMGPHRILAHGDLAPENHPQEKHQCSAAPDGVFQKRPDPDEKQELLEVIDNYRLGYVPLVVPTTLINHYVRKYHQPYLKEQLYLHPHPVELQLRNHV